MSAVEDAAVLGAAWALRPRFGHGSFVLVSGLRCWGYGKCELPNLERVQGRSDIGMVVEDILRGGIADRRQLILEATVNEPPLSASECPRTSSPTLNE